MTYTTRFFKCNPGASCGTLNDFMWPQTGVQEQSTFNPQAQVAKKDGQFMWFSMSRLLTNLYLNMEIFFAFFLQSHNRKKGLFMFLIKNDL